MASYPTPEEIPAPSIIFTAATVNQQFREGELGKEMVEGEEALAAVAEFERKAHMGKKDSVTTLLTTRKVTVLICLFSFVVFPRIE